MEANELMIGDWVLRRWTCSDTGREVVKDFQVTEIRKNGNTLYVWSESGNMGLVEQLEPIPITPEILEKNGFKIVHGFGYSESYPTYGWGYHKELRDYASVNVTFYDEPIGGVSRLVKMETASKKDDGINSIHSCDIGYVHELQHCLKLVGIDKEITI